MERLCNLPRAGRGNTLQQLSEQGRQRIDELAKRYSVSTDAVMTLLQSLVNGNGTMAQFNHRELGGGGQWMRGGMTMVGDMFNHGLKARVEGLCSELSQLLAQQPFVPFPPSFQGGFLVRRPTVAVPVASGNHWGNDVFGFFFQGNSNSQPANTRPRAGQYYQPMQQRWW